VNCQVCCPSDMECCAVGGRRSAVGRQTAGLKHANGPAAGHRQCGGCQFFMTHKNPLFFQFAIQECED